MAAGDARRLVPPLNTAIRYIARSAAPCPLRPSVVPRSGCPVRGCRRRRRCGGPARSDRTAARWRRSPQDVTCAVSPPSRVRQRWCGGPARPRTGGRQARLAALRARVRRVPALVRSTAIGTPSAVTVLRGGAEPLVVSPFTPAPAPSLRRCHPPLSVTWCVTGPSCPGSPAQSFGAPLLRGVIVTATAASSHRRHRAEQRAAPVRGRPVEQARRRRSAPQAAVVCRVDPTAGSVDTQALTS